MNGSIRVEFAETKEAAKKFAEENGLRFAKNIGTSPNGFPYVSGRFANSKERVALEAKLEALGWDRFSQIVSCYTPSTVRS